jgi:hypothetical protein
MGPLIDGERQIALAEQRARARRIERRQPFGIETGVAADRKRRAIILGRDIDDDQRHRSIALNLQGKNAAEFQRAGQRGAQRQGFRDQPGDRFGVVVPIEHIVRQGSQPGQAPTQRRAAGAAGL